MSNATEALHRRLTHTPYAPPEGSAVSVKFVLQSLLRNPSSGAGESQLQESIRNFVLASALLSASESSTHELLSWIPRQLAAAAAASFRDLSDVYCHGNDKRLVAELAPEVLLLLKDRIKESSIDKGTDGDEVSAASARVPVGFAILAAYQLRWFVTQIDKLNLGKLCNLVIPCALTALDHWSTENIASADEIWHLVVEMSVLLVSSIHQSNPRSHWYMGLVLLAHFRRLFPLFFKWIHADDDETVLLVLKRVHTVLKLTWIRNTPYIMRLVDELVALHKEAALRVCREEIRTSILEVLLLLKQCKGQQFTAAWEKHRDDSNLAALCLSLTEISIDEESSTSNTLRSDSPQNCLQLLTTH
ncbi:unnamed protein product [Linum tenue]|uniref:Uncharacterized protein n=1 Tax=Linum tenue TaxID=586396 RepID=A0AAV0JMB3_9ROSI|nr:unnamed protein product [Linum tenue]